MWTFTTAGRIFSSAKKTALSAALDIFSQLRGISADNAVQLWHIFRGIKQVNEEKYERADDGD